MHFLMAMIFHSLIPFITTFRYDIQETAFFKTMMLFYFDVHPFTSKREIAGICCKPILFLLKV